MALTDRDRAIVALVARQQALTRAQVAKALSFGSVTRANAVLLRLARHGYLSRRYQPTLAGTRRTVYLPGKAGRELLDGETRASSLRESSDLFLEHRLAVNDAWLAFERAAPNAYRLARWVPESELRKLPLGCIPDAYLEYEQDGQAFAAFLEADLGTESLKRWDAKVKAYTQLAFSGQFGRTFSRRYFRVLVVTTSERRVTTLRRAIRLETDRIFWLTTRDALVEAGPFAPVWQRPADGIPQSLTAN